MKRRICLFAAAAAAALMLAGCQNAVSSTPAASSAASDSAVSSSSVSSSSAATPTAAPTDTPAPSSSAAAEFPAGLPDAMSASLGWGGDAGSSLKSMIASCALLDWAEDNHASTLDATQLSAETTKWISALEGEDYSIFVENWESVSSNADLILSYPDAVAGLLSDAGNPNQHDSYTQADWDALKQAIDFGLAAQSRAVVTT